MDSTTRPMTGSLVAVMGWSLCLAAPASLSADTLLLEDDFDIRQESSLDPNERLDRRQAGELAPVPYYLDPATRRMGEVGIREDALYLAQPALVGNGVISGVFLDHDFSGLPGTAYRIAFDLTLDGTNTDTARFTLSWDGSAGGVGNASLADGGLMLVADGRVFFASKHREGMDLLVDYDRDLRGEMLSLALEFDESRSEEVSLFLDGESIGSMPLIFGDDSHRTLCLRAVKDGKDTESVSVRIDNLRVTAK